MDTGLVQINGNIQSDLGDKLRFVSDAGETIVVPVKLLKGNGRGNIRLTRGDAEALGFTDFDDVT